MNGVVILWVFIIELLVLERVIVIFVKLDVKNWERTGVLRLAVLLLLHLLISQVLLVGHPSWHQLGVRLRHLLRVVNRRLLGNYLAILLKLDVWIVSGLLAWLRSDDCARLVSNVIQLLRVIYESSLLRHVEESVDANLMCKLVLIAIVVDVVIKSHILLLFQGLLILLRLKHMLELLVLLLT